MAGGFSLSLIADVRDWLKGTKAAEDSMESLSSTLDKVATDTEQDATKAASAIETKFTDALDKVKAESKTAGDSVGDNLKRGSDEASEGTKTFKENARQNAKEVAASFDGSAQSIADGFQGLAAEAFEGFGPAGVAAGVAAGAGLGLISKAIEDANEQADEIKSKIADIREELTTLDGDTTKLDYATEFRKWGEEIDGNTKKIDRLRQMSASLGIDEHTLYMAWTGDQDAKQKVLDATAAQQQQINDLQAKGDISDSLRQRSAALRTNVELLGQYSGWVGQANDGLSIYNDFIGDSADKTKKLTQAQKDAEKASDTFSGTLTDNLSVADEGLDKFVKKGKLNLKEWSDELKRRASENKRIKDFTVDMEAKLSPEALESFAELPTETQAEIEKAYRKGSKKDQKKIRANLEAEAKIDKVTFDTSKADAAANNNPIEVPTTIDASGLPADVAKASNSGQSVANKDGNKIQFKTKIDRDELQRQVDRAAASIHSPTITVKTRVEKQVP